MGGKKTPQCCISEQDYTCFSKLFLLFLSPHVSFCLLLESFPAAVEVEVAPVLLVPLGDHVTFDSWVTSHLRHSCAGHAQPRNHRDLPTLSL